MQKKELRRTQMLLAPKKKTNQQQNLQQNQQQNQQQNLQQNLLQNQQQNLQQKQGLQSLLLKRSSDADGPRQTTAAKISGSGGGSGMGCQWRRQWQRRELGRQRTKEELTSDLSSRNWWVSSASRSDLSGRIVLPPNSERELTLAPLAVEAPPPAARRSTNVA